MSPFTTPCGSFYRVSFPHTYFHRREVLHLGLPIDNNVGNDVDMVESEEAPIKTKRRGRLVKTAPQTSVKQNEDLENDGNKEEDTNRHANRKTCRL